MKNNDKKAFQLGMPAGTASGRLRKSIIFMLLEKLNMNVCFQCNEQIESESDLSIEHKIPYLDSGKAVELFFDLSNIGFSHLVCNIKASRPRPQANHPSMTSHRKGCRCKGCVELYNEYQKNWIKEKRNKTG